MTTEAITTTSLPAQHLAEALTQVMPHMARNSLTPILESVHLDSNGTYLHAVATDRYTIAVARRRLHSGEEWTATVGAMHTAYLHSWAEAHNYRDTVQLYADPGQLTVTSNMGRIVLPTMDGPYAPWRALFNQQLAEPAELVDTSVLDTQYLSRWTKGGAHLEISQAAKNKPLILAREDFIGMQMPAKQMRGVEPGRAALAADWERSLDAAADPGADLPLPGPDAAPPMAEELLRQVLISTQELFDTGTEDSVAFHAHVRSGVHGWMAYRLLEALRTIDPRTAERVAADLEEELDCGEFSETAYDAAEKAGHDPAKWLEDYQAARERVAEQNQAEQQADAKS